MMGKSGAHSHFRLIRHALFTVEFIAAVALLFTAACGPGTSSGGGKELRAAKLPLVYSDRYNISFMGLQKFHPFDSEKYRRIHGHLTKKAGIFREAFHEPEPATDADLLAVHTREYLESLNDSATVARVAEMPMLRHFPERILRNNLLLPMRYGVGGTVLGARLALEHGWAVNLSGGYHHAKRDGGEGFCFYADIPLAIHFLWKTRRDLRVLIIDLDAHQGNGFASILGNDPRVYILDVYNREVYPGDTDAMRYIDMNLPIPSGTGDAEYLGILTRALPRAFWESRPDLVVYNAGVDILAGDPLGRLGASGEGIIKRDQMVFSMAKAKGVPILMVLSGGYTRRSGELAGRSIENVLRQVLGVLP